MFRLMLKLFWLSSPVYLGDQSHLILGLDHQPSPQTPFASYVYLTKIKQGCLSFRQDSFNFWNTQIHVARNILEQSLIYDVAWNILGQRMLYNLAFFTLEMLKLINIIYALIQFFQHQF